MHLLASNADRVVSKDEIIEKIWDGRVVSDSAISTSVKEARQAVGITPGLVRISVGLEHPDDIVRDVEQALARSAVGELV